MIWTSFDDYPSLCMYAKYQNVMHSTGPDLGEGRIDNCPGAPPPPTKRGLTNLYYTFEYILCVIIYKVYKLIICVSFQSSMQICHTPTNRVKSCLNKPTSKRTKQKRWPVTGGKGGCHWTVPFRDQCRRSLHGPLFPKVHSILYCFHTN